MRFTARVIWPHVAEWGLRNRLAVNGLPFLTPIAKNHKAKERPADNLSVGDTEKMQETVGLANSFTSMLKRYRDALFAFLKGKRDSIRANTASASRLIPAVVRKPAVIWRWLLASSWFYLSVIIALILMKTAVPSAVDATLAKIYPQIETKRVFGLIVQKSDDPRIVWQRKIILGLLWTGVFGLNAYVLLLCLPGTVRKADIKARQKEAMADKMVTLKPSESILLYTKALKLAVDQAHESILTSKIDTLDNVMKTGHIELESPTPATNPNSPGTGTILLPKQDLAGHPEQGGAIGPDFGSLSDQIILLNFMEKHPKNNCFQSSARTFQG